ncbi:MAG: hypothetical protein ACK5FV_04975 [Bacteroidota bacterium]|nr:hypothetical protein [Saprospiraceae bacterium]
MYHDNNWKDNQATSGGGDATLVQASSGADSEKWKCDDFFSAGETVQGLRL